MADINREMQERVWQRVRGQAEPVQADPGEPGVQALLLGELTDAALLRKAGGDALNTLARQASERADILRGICILTQTDTPGKLPPAKEPGPAVLRLLMGSLLRRQKEYCRLQEQPEFGTIYTHLAQSAQNSCALLAKYIGLTPLAQWEKIAYNEENSFYSAVISEHCRGAPCVLPRADTRSAPTSKIKSANRAEYDHYAGGAYGSGTATDLCAGYWRANAHQRCGDWPCGGFSAAHLHRLWLQPYGCVYHHILHCGIH